MKGEIGAKERDGLTVQNAAKIDADTKIISTQRQGEGKKAEIQVKTNVKIFENQKEAEVAEANAELAKKKAGWTKAAQLAEVQEANWDLYKKQKAAEAALYEKQKNAEAQRVNAEAALYARQQIADGEFYAKKKEAEGITALAQAQGHYLSTLLKPLGGNYGALRDYMMINGRVYQDIASTNAQAVQGLQPKISIWSNGNGGEEGGNAVNGGLKDVAGVYSMLPPLFKTVHEQTGMLPPPWMGSLTDAAHPPSSN